MILPSKDWNQILSRFFPQLSQPRIRNSTQKSSYGDFRHRTSTLFPTQCQVCLIAWTRFHPGSGHAFAIHHATPVPRTVQPKGIIHSFMAYILDRGETDRRIISLNGEALPNRYHLYFWKTDPGPRFVLLIPSMFLTHHDQEFLGTISKHLRMNWETITAASALGPNDTHCRLIIERFKLQSTLHPTIATVKIISPSLFVLSNVDFGPCWFKMFMYTLPETKIAHKNRPSQKETSIPTIHFQVLLLLVSGRVYTWNFIEDCCAECDLFDPTSTLGWVYQSITLATCLEHAA